MNWGSLWVLPWFPSVSELQGLRPSGQTLHPLYLTISSPTCTQLQGLLRQGVTREKSFHFKSLCFCFPSQAQEICCTGRMVCDPLFWRGKNYCSHSVLCLGRGQFNPHFPVAPTMKLPGKHRFRWLLYQSSPRGGLSHDCHGNATLQPDSLRKIKIKRGAGERGHRDPLEFQMMKASSDIGPALLII